MLSNAYLLWRGDDKGIVEVIGRKKANRKRLAKDRISSNSSHVGNDITILAGNFPNQGAVVSYKGCQAQ